MFNQIGNKNNTIQFSKNIKVNLHCHSSCSDGRYKPSQVVELLGKEGVTFLALTDHDTIEGLVEANEAARKININFINGIEFSTNINTLNLDFLDSENHTIHLLGLGFDYNKLNNTFIKRKEEKKVRLMHLVNKLEKKGYKFDVIPEMSKKTLIAKNLVNNGYAECVQDAFDNIINRYYDRKDDQYTVEIVVDIIHDAGGKVFWAHPFDIVNGITKEGLDRSKVNTICQKLKDKNVDGIEAYYEPYTINQIEFLKKTSRNHGFDVSFGTDFHGKSKEEKSYVNVDLNLFKEIFK